MSDHIIKAVAAAGAGAVIGWTVNALTLSPRVEAIEKGLQRVETTLQVLTTQRAVPVKP